MNICAAKQEARCRGDKFYFTGKPCPHGHICKRLVSSGGCWECSKIKRKKWGASLQGREKLKAGYRRCYANNIETRRKYRVENTEKYKKYSKERHQKITDLLFVLKREMPDLLKEFGL